MFYVSSTLMWSYPVEQSITIAKEHDYAGMEIWAEHVWFYNSDPEKIKSIAKQENLALSLHAASWDLNLCALNKGIRAQSVQEIIKSLDLACQLNASCVTIHPGKMTLSRDWLAWHIEVLAENLDILAKAAKERERILSLEHIEPIKKEFIIYPKDMQELLEKISYPLTTTFDIAHVPLGQSLPQFYAELPYVNKVHISDATKEKLHLPLGTGEVDLESILPLLIQNKEMMVVEGYDTSLELYLLKQNTNYLQDKYRLC